MGENNSKKRLEKLIHFYISAKVDTFFKMGRKVSRTFVSVGVV